MERKINSILEDLYKIEPELKKNEKELIKTLNGLLAIKPEAGMKEDFNDKLKSVLLTGFDRQGIKKRLSVLNIIAMSGFRRVLASFIGIIAVILLVYYTQTFIGKKAPLHKTNGQLQQSLDNFDGKKSAIAGNAAAGSEKDKMRAAKKPLRILTKLSADMAEESAYPARPAPSSGLTEAARYKQKNLNTESYGRITENNFKETVREPLSTFSIDVDTASYANVRRFIREGEKPDPDAVRIEEMLNYFTYHYEEPSGDEPFGFHTELSECPWNKSHLLLLVGLQAKKVGRINLPPNNLVFLIDVSGSMDEPNKLPLIKSGLKLLVNEMRPRDKIAMVVYAGSAGLVLEPTPGNEKQKIINALEHLEAGGSTAGGEGLILAYRTAEKNFRKGSNNRIILATDGDFNVGASSDADMVRLIEKERDKGIALTVLGFGMGNYKDSKMENIADKGNGNYAYIDSLQEAEKVLVSQMGGTLLTVAKDVKIQIEFNPVLAKSYRLLGYEDRTMQSEDFNNDKKDAGEMGAGHTVTALYEIVLQDGKQDANDLKYQKMEIKKEALESKELMTIKFRYKKPDENISKLKTFTVGYNPLSLNKTSDDFRFAAAVAEWGLLLRDSEFKGKSGMKQVSGLAKGALGSDDEGYRQEFLDLVKKSEMLFK